MPEEIRKLVLDYINDKKDIDSNFVNKVIMIAKEYYGLDDYIKSVYSFKKGFSSDASYHIDTGFIVVYILNIYKTLSSLETDFSELKKSPSFKYLYCVHILLHEVEHALQQKMIDTGVGVEADILRAEFEPINGAKSKVLLSRMIEYRRLHRIYKKFYTFAVSERLAEVKSFETAANVSMLLNDQVSYDFMNYYVLYNLRRGYNTGLANDMSDEPTKYYLEQINPDFDFSEIDEKSEMLDFETKVRLGLRVSKDELHTITKPGFELSLKLNGR